MKITKVHILILSFVVLLCSGLFAQEPDTSSILAQFDLRQVNNKIQVDFAIKGGSSCNGVELERSLDNEEFEVVEIIPGVCGGTDKTEYYTIVDSHPVENRKNYYRLQLGQQEKSETYYITFIPLENGLRVYPNPAVDFTLIRFENPQNLNYDLLISDARGRTVERFSGISSQEIYMDLSDYPDGMYYFVLTAPLKNAIKGKFLVISQHD